jgi:DNA-binding winged helix-turn-helix (wHTH) protein/class 3 adenylate cyclase/tetratricopeptide (TPR) repeat protein
MRYVFADCLLDTQLYTLSRAGLAIPLQPKVFQALRYLLEHRDHLVSKEELCTHVWPAQFISDATIEGCIKRARQAIGDTGRAQQLIQTRRSYGYRFVGTVEEQPEAPPARAPTVTLGLSPATPRQDDTRRRPEPIRLPGEDPVASSAGAASPAPRSSLVSRIAPASTMQSAPVGERKLVTLLGCALAQAAALRAHEGLDALHSQMRTLYTLTQQEVHRYGGTIHHVAGTRLLAIFGAPVAHEDHARRAVLAAWGLHQRLAASRSEDPAEEPLAACLGLHTGLVVMGGIGEAQGTAAVVGDLTLAVEALQERAVPGMLLCSETTAHLVRQHVRLEEVASVPVQGQPNPVRTYQVMGLRAPDVSGAQVALRSRSPFVGRAHELATLHAVLAQVVGGRGQAVGIVGEPGIGKSRLLMEWHQRLRAHGVAYLEGHCLSYGNATPYLPVLDLLRAHCGITPVDGDDTITAKVYGSLQAVGLAPDTGAPVLLHLLGVEAATAQVADISPDTLKAHTFATLRQLWLKSSQQHPLILAVEDLHWSDPTSEEFVASLVEGLPGTALLVLGTYRPGYRPAWLEKSYATQLTVPPLSAQDSVQVVRAVLQQETVPLLLAEALLAKAQGNPFFLEELAQTLMEQDAGQDEPSGQSPLPRPAPADLQLPPTVQAVLAARIDRLVPEAKHLLQTAAVIGTDIPVPLLQVVAELSEVALHQGLAHLQAAEFLYETHRFTEYVYIFKHALTHDVVYGSLLQERRRGLHARIVEALEALAGDRVVEVASGAKVLPAGGQDPDQVDRLAHHALRGEVWAKALLYCRQAGEKAMARSAYHEAVRYFEQGLRALAHLPEMRDTREQAIDLRLALRAALHPCGDLGRAMAYLREAETLAAALDDPHRLGQVSVAFSLHCYLMGAYGQAIAAAQHALALAAAGGEVVLHLLANLHLGIVYQTQGDYRRAIDCLWQTMTSLDGVQHHERFGEMIPAVFTRAYLAACHAELGTFAEGRSVGDEGLQIAETVDHPMNLMFALWGSGLLALRQGDLSRALPLLERAVRLFQDADRPASFPLIATTLGATYTLSGRVADAVPLLTQAMAQTTATGLIVSQALCCLPLGEAQLLAGRLEEALALAEQALVHARAHQERGSEAYALHLLGTIAARRDPPENEQAKAYYQQARALAEELGMRPLQAHCHLSLGILYSQTGQPEQARAELSAAIALYRTMDMTFWLPQAEAALTQAGRGEEPGGQ